MNYSISYLDANKSHINFMNHNATAYVENNQMYTRDQNDLTINYWAKHNWNMAFYFMRQNSLYFTESNSIK